MRIVAGLAGLVPLAALSPLPALSQAIQLEDVVLSANRAPSDPTRTGSSVTVLTGAEIEANGRPFVLEQLRDLPGVAVNQNGPAGTVSGFAVRGLPQQYVRVEVEGIEISDMTAPQVSPSLSGLLIDDVSRVEVLRGSQSALYGGQAVAGVVSIAGPRPTEPGIENRFILEGGSFSTFRGAYSLSGLNDTGEFALTISRLQSDGFSAADEADGATEDDGYRTTRLSGSGRIFVTDQTDLFASAFWQEEDGDYDDAPSPEPPFGDADNTFDATTYGLRAGVDYTTLGGVTHTLAASYFDVDRSQINSFGPFDSQGSRIRVEYFGEVAVAPTLTYQWGADYARQSSENTFSTEETDDVLGAFVQSNWAPTDRVAVDAAARLDDHSEFGLYPTGRLTAAFLATPDTTIRGSLGTGFRAPSIFEQANSTGLEPETSVSADLGVTQGFAGGRGQASATLFWIEVDDLIEYDDVTFTYVQSGGASRSQGVELSALYEFADWATVSASYTYTDANKPDGTPGDRVPLHEVNLAVAGAATDRISYAVDASFVHDFYDSTGIDSAAFEEDYVVLDARLAYAVTDQAEVYVRAANLLDTEYQTARGYATADRAFYAGVAARF